MSDQRRMFRLSQSHLLGVLSLLLLWAGSTPAQSPHDWLERMVGATGMYNFQGTFVHMCDGTMDIVRIVHRVDNGQVTERITSDSAGGRQIIRNADEVMCILPDQKKVTVERRDAASSPIGAQISNFPSFSNIHESFYEVTMLGPDRVAERNTVMLAIRPLDDFRYGYRLWLDHSTALPLKFELVDGDGNELEQGTFTDIQFSESIPRRDVEPTIATEGFVWQRSAAVTQLVPGTARSAHSDSVTSTWHAAALPPGFELTFAESKIAAEDDVPMEQLVYTDGLATISVFIEASAEAAADVEGESRIGATHAFSTLRSGFLITAMGGVPPGTARMVALSVTRR